MSLGDKIVLVGIMVMVIACVLAAYFLMNGPDE